MSKPGELFSRLKREHVEQACRRLVKEGTFAGGGSYFIRFDGSELPAKRVLREACALATGDEVSPSAFSGGQYTAKILSDLGFEVIVRQ